jgi:hypothetical protein
MPITQPILLSELNLAGNPILAKIYCGDGVSKRWRIIRYIASAPFFEVIYEGSVYTKLDIYAEINISSIFEELKRVSGIHTFEFQLNNDNGNFTNYSSQAIRIYGGGISKLLQRKLAKMNADIFSWKLKDSTTNFLLSTRTNNDVLPVPENELIPFGYYAKGHKFYIKADGDTVGTYDHSLDQDESLQYIDFSVLRQAYAIASNKLVSVFDIVTDTSYSFSVIIIEAIQQTEYFIKFRNSWGEWEQIALYGLLSFSPTIAEGTTVSKWDAQVNEFADRANRPSVSNIYTANTGYRSEADRLFIIDMLLSDTKVLIANGDEYEVKVTAELPAVVSTDGIPVNVTLNIELVDKDSYYGDLKVESAYRVLTKTTLENITSGNADILV